MPKTAEKERAKNSKKVEKNFSLTGEETALLLQIIIDYKSNKAALGLDWETVRSRYEDICERLQSRYPKESSGVDAEEYPNCSDPSVITKEKIIPKIKRIKMQFRKAVDSGRRSGGGRIVLSLYEECNEIWAGSPAVESLSEGIESSIGMTPSAANSTLDDSDSDLLADQSSSSAGFTDITSSETLDATGKDYEEEPSTRPKTMGEKRRNLLQHLKEKKDSKLTKRLSAVLSCLI